MQRFDDIVLWQSRDDVMCYIPKWSCSCGQRVQLYTVYSGIECRYARREDSLCEDEGCNCRKEFNGVYLFADVTCLLKGWLVAKQKSICFDPRFRH